MSPARQLDQFYTNPVVAKHCYQTLVDLVAPAADTYFIEPSAGTGSFFDLLPIQSRLGLDIDPKHPEVITQDFFDYKAPADKERIIVVGNPPFGINTSLASRFFNHAASFAETIAFIVPISFRKDSMIKRLNPYFELIYDETLTPDAFVFNGAPYSVPCCFQIWRRAQTPRIAVAGPLSHPDFNFVKRTIGTFAFKRVGRLAGKVITDFTDYATTSHFFIKASDGRKDEEVIAVLEAIDWSQLKWNTAGVASISKREMVAAYTKAVESRS